MDTHKRDATPATSACRGLRPQAKGTAEQKLKSREALNRLPPHLENHSRLSGHSWETACRKEGGSPQEGAPSPRDLG